MNYILFDPPETWKNLLPLTFTRPVSEIRVGILSVREKWEKRIDSPVSWLTENYLAEKFPVIYGTDNLYINGSTLPDDKLINAIHGLSPGEAIYSGNNLLAARLAGKDSDAFSTEGNFVAKSYENKIACIFFPWDIFTINGSALVDDFNLLVKGRKSLLVSQSNQVIGSGSVFLEDGAVVECASLNTVNGPIYIGRGAEVMEGSLVRGPFSLGENSTLKLGAKIYGPTTIGPDCKVGGEINNSVFQGYSNKAHDGFMGNAVIGEWCNIGADTNNSNLKNNYAEVRLWNYNQEKFLPSGLIFCGLIMGDHSKCGINTMFNTGTVIGVNANIFGSGFPRNFIPSFSWGGPHGFTTYQPVKALEVAREVMKRRNRELEATDIRILEEIFRMTEKYRT